MTSFSFFFFMKTKVMYFKISDFFSLFTKKRNHELKRILPWALAMMIVNGLKLKILYVQKKRKI